ncbi:hypothetical protein FisN_38Lu036 [Fistulifera solaris]|uniref:Uncharacterized protein n=1 Tax=Fistulifera solaris TaxID=1519565 RepID=A0A1Z5J714_FISSO|nr:hypothetical protein FisN_38Lu036 [Fistulifera solaris]|eukprot:GAX09608.1 hypothetical protein FisN_38Lu036 [Fistulifera solaris]
MKLVTQILTQLMRMISIQFRKDEASAMAVWNARKCIFFFALTFVTALSLSNLCSFTLHLSTNHLLDDTLDSWAIIEPQISVKPPLYTQKEAFAACILVLDQNHRLTEWLAYHYFALPLRTVIIAYDPKATGRATKLLDRWRDVIEFIEWDDDDYLPPNWAADMARNNTDVRVYLHRQPIFMKECTKVAASKNITRVLHSDVDEYLRINAEIVSSDLVNTSEPGHITKFLNQLEQINNTLFRQSNGYGRACTVFWRYHYVPVLDEPNSTQVSYNPASASLLGKDSLHFDTLRFPHRAQYVTRLPNPKGLVNLKYITVPELEKVEMMVHFPLGRACRQTYPNITLLIFNHYIGSYESFLYGVRNDPRYSLTRTKFEERVFGGGGMVVGQDSWRALPPLYEDTIVGWVPAFYEWQSKRVADYLLHDTGLRAVLPELIAQFPNISNSYIDRQAEQVLLNELQRKHEQEAVVV